MASCVFSKTRHSSRAFCMRLALRPFLDERKLTVCPMYSGRFRMFVTVAPFHAKGLLMSVLERFMQLSWMAL